MAVPAGARDIASSAPSWRTGSRTLAEGAVTAVRLVELGADGPTGEVHEYDVRLARVSGQYADSRTCRRRGAPAGRSRTGSRAGRWA